MGLPKPIDGVIDRLREIDAGLPGDDGVAVFNRMYLTVTERIAALITDPTGGAVKFRDPETMAVLDVAFANLWLSAFAADAAGKSVTPAWRPLFQARRSASFGIQYAVAGMNTHIEHDLPIAVVATCRARRLDPDDVHHDFETVNAILAEVESPIRRSFLDSVGKRLDDRAGPVVHVLSGWSIDKARDLSWVTAETIWALRRTPLLRDRFLTGLGHTVGMTTRVLLTPTA